MCIYKNYFLINIFFLISGKYKMSDKDDKRVKIDACYKLTKQQILSR